MSYQESTVVDRRPTKRSKVRLTSYQLMALGLAVLYQLWVAPVVGFTIDGPNLDEGLLRVTVFAEGLNYPVGMAELDDGSILAAVTNEASYFGSTAGSLVRLADDDGDGIAEQRQTLVSNVPGGKLSAL